MKNLTLLLIIFTVFSLPVYAESKKSTDKYITLAQDVETIKLTKLLDAVSKSTDRKFLINAKARSEVVAYGVDTKTITLNELLLVLENNQLGAFETAGYVNVVPLGAIKQSPIPVITPENKVENEFLWVSKVIDIGNLNSGILKPMLRTLVPTHGHFADYAETNKMLIVAPFNNIKRIEAIVQSLQTQRPKLAMIN